MQNIQMPTEFVNSLTAKRVYSEPVTEGGVTLITAAAIRGGGGMRNGAADGDTRGGMGVVARPVGAYVVRGGRAVWKPAFDLSRIALRGQLVIAAGLLLLSVALLRRGAARS